MQLNKFKDEKEDNSCVEYFESSQGKRSVKYKLIKSNQDLEIRIAQ